MVLSAEAQADLQLLALNAASAALYVSEIPLNFSVNGVRIGRIDGEFVINPNLKAMEQSTLDLFVSGVDEELLMIEMRTFGGANVSALGNPLNLVSTLMDDTKAKFSANELTEKAYASPRACENTYCNKE